MKLLLENWHQYLNENVSYRKPNFEYEWSEAQRYPKLKEMGKKDWLQITALGAPAQVGMDIPLADIGNTTGPTTEIAKEKFNELEAPKRKRFMSAFESGEIEMPIIIKIDDKYDLLAGNTRFTGLMANNIVPQVWLIDVDKLV